MKFLKLLPTAFLMLMVIISGRVWAQEGGSIDARLKALEDKLSGLEQRVDRLSQSENPIASGTPSGDTSGDRWDALDQKLRILERKKELADEELATRQKQAPLVTAGNDGFSISSADKSNVIRFGATIQADTRFYRSDPTNSLPETFTLGKIRPILQGTVFKYIDFRIMPDFGNGGTISLQDAYADLRFIPNATLRLGKAKAPLGLERLQQDTDIWFYDRGLPTDLVPNRDEGVQVYSTINNLVTYQVALTNGVTDGGSIDVDVNNGKDLVGRIFVTPFTKTSIAFLKGFGLGIAGSNGEQSGTLPSFKTPAQNTFFSYASTAHAQGVRNRFSPQISYFYGPFGFMSEYVQSTQKIAGANNVARSITNDAWQVAGSYFLTGEAATYGRVATKRSFLFDRRGTLGGFQLTGRYMVLSVDPTVFNAGFANPNSAAQKAKAFTVGFNWYLNRFLKYTFNYEQTKYTRGATVGNRLAEKAILGKLQVAF